MSKLATRKMFLDRLLAKQGAPYVWGGKGWDLWSLQGLYPHHFGLEVFDCAGLITCALHEAGGPDWRGTHNAQAIFNLALPVRFHNRPLNLLFYGPHEKDIEHIAVVVGCSACEGPQFMLKVEAAGGDRSTTTPRNPLGSARVTVRRENRADFLGERFLPPDILEYTS